ncbi:hypothetical protein P5G50_01575 [Leifsonia sp. F6_8S_P_1B]|uniref:MarR family transcriptional regulator n=1 Tax=Leifsonia williamsii TaxID=3035919 RepID=A0ABT8K6Q1_9MICO|nr:hypothetical protein [Leifsonia williamsii]MDN4613128.1 hypothetical protein [Leifsonia williamsii]
MTNIDDSNTPGASGPDMPPGYWFGEIQSRLRERMRDALAEQDLRRGSWRILHLLADGPATAQELADRLPRGRRHGRAESASEGRPGWYGRPEWRGGRPHPGFRRQDPDFRETGPRGGGERVHGDAWHHDDHRQDPDDRRHEYGRDHERQDDQHPQHHDHHGHHHDEHPQHHDEHPHHHDERGQHDHQHDRHDERDHHDHHPGTEAAFERGFERGFLRGFGADLRRHFDPRAGFGRPGFGPAGPWFGRRDFPGRPFGPHPHHRPRRIERTLADFTERGWVWFDGDRATLTDEGRAAHDAAEQRVEQVRASLADGIDPADWATTMRTLERMAGNLGWERPA